MPPVDLPVKRKRKRPALVRVTPDQADRSRSPGQRARDRRTVNRNIEHAKVRARVTPDQADRLRSPVQKTRDAAVVRRNVAESRLKYLRKTNRGSGSRALKRELEGKGIIPKLATAIAQDVSTIFPSAQQQSGKGRESAILAALKGKKLGATQQQALPKHIPANLVNDLTNVPAQVIPSLYLTAAAANEAAFKGRPQRAESMWKDFKQTDPFYNLGAAAVEGSRGNSKQAKSHLEKARKQASEHPGFTALEVYGAKGVVGRGSGAAVRGGARVTGSKKLKEIGSTKRAPASLPGTNVIENRSYSKDLIRKRGQKLSEAQGRRDAAALRKKAEETADPKRRNELLARARRKDPDIINDRQIGRRVDEHVAMRETIRRTNQGQTLKVERKELKQAEKGGPIVSLLAQRIVRPTLKSLTTYRDDLKAVQPDLKGAKLAENRQLVHDIDRAIERVRNGEVSLDDMRAIADRYAERNVASQQRLTAHGIYADEQSERRALMPFAVRELGAAKDKELLKGRAKETGKTAKKTNQAAKRARGRALSAEQEHRRQSAIEKERAELLPQLPPSMLEAMVKAAEGRQKQVKRQKTKAKRKTAAAQTTRQAADEARALQKANPLLVGGREVTTRELREALEEAHGEGAQAAVVSQRPPQRVGGGDFYRSGLTPAKGEKRGLGGAATREGGFDASTDALLRQQTRSDALATQAEGYADFIDEFGRRFLPEDAEQIKRLPGDKEGELLTRDTRDQAQQVADDLTAKGDVKWTVAPSAMRGSDDGPWAIIPAEAAKRQKGHQDVMNATTLERGMRSVASGFQRTVLATSLPWMVGNTAEASLRSAMNRVGPGSYVRGRQYLKAIRALDADAARNVEARMLGGGPGAFLDRQIHSNLDNYADGMVRDMTAAGKALRGAPVVKYVPKAWDIWTHHVFNTVNKTIEQAFQTGMLGRAVKEELMTGDLQRVSKQAIEEFATKGGLERNTAVKLGREIDKMYGRYEKFSPDARALLARYTPFGAWLRNAVEFLVTAPERHPTSTLAATAAVSATEDERKRLGLDIDWFNKQPGERPGWLQGAIPDGKGGSYRLTRFTPMSLATDPLGTVAGSVLPQYRSVLYAMNGLDWTGKPLKGKNGTEATTADEVKAAATALADATVPFAAIGKRVAAKGLKTIPQSAVGYSPPSKGRPGSGKAKPAPPDEFDTDFDADADVEITLDDLDFD